MPSRPNLLMVCYFHPPAATGVRRLVSLLRHLPDRGWNPVVLACRETAGAGRDDGPLRDPRVARTPVVRTASLDPYRLAAAASGSSAQPSASSLPNADRRSLGKSLMQFLRRHVFLPDDRMGWIPFAVFAGIRLARRAKVRAIYSSNYPQSAHVVALVVQAATGLPWLADFRDGWTQNPAFHDPGNPLLRAGQRLLERLVARRADAIVTVSPPITRHLQRLRPSHLRPPETVFNGFEVDEFPPSEEPAEPFEPDRLALLYAGTFFGRRTPMPFFKALHRLLRDRPDLRDRLRVRMRTSLEPRWLRAIERARLADVVQVLPPIPFARCIAEQRRADACLLVLEDGPGADIMVSQKVFEYLAARRPVFAMVPEGAAAEVLRSTGGAEISVAESPAAAARRLAAFVDRVASNSFPPADESALDSFRRDRQAARIAAILDDISSKP